MIRVIHDARRYREYLARICELLSLEFLTEEESDELELLAFLVDKYEDKKWPISSAPHDTRPAQDP
jgi:antitoxin component HigA of HigAB toxin-antitoxin module